MPNNSPVRLYIGIGGSGLKTLTAFVETLAQHGEWGDDTETHCAFILADTDENDLRKYESLIREAARRIGKDPIVRAVQTSEGVTSFQHYAADQLERAAHHDRVKEHWWYNGEAPFTAERLTGSPVDGAGQCPMVSTFLAWNILNRVADEVKSVVEQLQRRLTLGDGDQDWTLHTTVVAGLAGGTGRGCWHLLATKVREVLAQTGRHTMPVGYFYDWSVYAETGPDSGMTNKMRVNALTGFSELAGWMRNETSPQPYNFQLPNLSRPQDNQSDVIDVLRVVAGPGGKELKGVPGQSPVNQAFVVFGSSRAGRPGAPEAYYRVVANAMYARLVREVASRAVNGAAFGGIGAASIAIPVNAIRAYVRGYVGKFLPLTIANQVEAAHINQWVGLLTDGLKSPQAFTYSPKADGSVVERILSGVMANAQPRLRKLSECMEPKSKDYKRAGEECRRLDGWADSKDGSAAIQTIADRVLVSFYWGNQPGPDAVGTGGLMRDVGALDRLSSDDFGEIFGGGDSSVKRKNPLSEALRRLVMRSKLRMSLPDGTSAEIDISGFGTKAVLARQLVAALQDMAKKVPGAPVGNDPGTPGSVLSHDVFEKSTKGFFDRGIDTNEAGMISDAASSRVRMRSMGPVQEALKRTYNQAADELNGLVRGLDQVVAQLRSFAEDVDRDLKPHREQLFWTADDFVQAKSQASESTFAGRILTDQVLQPLANDAALERALSAEMTGAGNQRFEAGLSEFVSRLEGWIRAADPAVADSERQRELRRMMTKGIEAIKGDLVLNRKFFVDTFGFFATIRGLLESWGEEFVRRAGSEQETKRLKTAFLVQFGCDYPFDKDGPVRLSGDELDAHTRKTCAAMAVSLGNRCDVLFEVRRDNASVMQDDVVAVIAPSEIHFTGDFKNAAETLARDRGLFRVAGSFVVHPTHNAHAMGNPFLMIAYAQENFPNWKSDDGLDRVASLQYYRDPETTRWLEACEDPTGRSFFVDDNKELAHASESFGLGFVSRVFVTNEALSKHRWKPWLKAGAAGQDARQAFVLDALAFALCDEPAGDSGSALMRVHEAENWSIPIMSLRSPGQAESQSKKWEFARSAFRDDFGIWVANNPAFKAGDGYTSIRKLLDALEGDQNPLVEAIATEAVHYLKSVLAAHSEDVSADGALVAMFRDLRARLTVAKDAETGPTKDDFGRLYDRLTERIEALAKLNCKELHSHFDRRGRS
jgi:hypothetical protein